MVAVDCCCCCYYWTSLGWPYLSQIIHQIARLQVFLLLFLPLLYFVVHGLYQLNFITNHPFVGLKKPK